MLPTDDDDVPREVRWLELERALKPSLTIRQRLREARAYAQCHYLPMLNGTAAAVQRAELVRHAVHQRLKAEGRNARIAHAHIPLIGRQIDMLETIAESRDDAAWWLSCEGLSAAGVIGRIRLELSFRDPFNPYPC